MKIASSRIDKVTVYPNSALVTREVEVPAGDGLVELTVSPMPHQIVPATMYSEGAEGLRILTTRFSTRQTFEDTSEERRKLASLLPGLLKRIAAGMQIAGANEAARKSFLADLMKLHTKVMGGPVTRTGPQEESAASANADAKAKPAEPKTVSAPSPVPPAASPTVADKPAAPRGAVAPSSAPDKPAPPRDAPASAPAYGPGNRSASRAAAA